MIFIASLTSYIFNSSRYQHLGKVTANTCEPNFTIDLFNATPVPLRMIDIHASRMDRSFNYLAMYFLCGLLSNLTFIWTVMRTQSLHTITFKYLVNLAISNILAVLFFSIPNIVYFTTTKVRIQSFIFDLIPNFFFLSSIGTITIVSVERFLAICHPIKHRLVSGIKRTNLLICCTWTVAFVYTNCVFND